MNQTPQGFITKKNPLAINNYVTQHRIDP